MNSRTLKGTVTLPGSKSESNRALMIASYGGFTPDIDNLSEAHDTVLMKALLEQVHHHDALEPLTLDCEDAGTVARFMLTYLACQPGEWILTGTKRLCERPMAPLIDALCQLGADIAPTSLRAFLIRGKKLQGGRVTLDASQSSQFVSSLLLAAPTWDEGLQLNLKGETGSDPYIEMTLAIMKQFGVETIRNGNTIVVAHQSYQPCHFVVSADWSAASYWYEMLAMSAWGSLLLRGLRQETLQGDVKVAELFKPLGVNTEFGNNGVVITSKGDSPSTEKPLEFDFLNTPDLFPSVLVTCVSLHIDAVFYGITTLFNKESDRVNSLISELKKYYTFINIIENDKLVILNSSLSDCSINDRSLYFSTFDDHRLAIALAGLKVVFRDVRIDRPNVVNKSYPTFWDDLENVFGD